jgi:hypothetical protein
MIPEHTASADTFEAFLVEVAGHYQLCHKEVLEEKSLAEVVLNEEESAADQSSVGD